MLIGAGVYPDPKHQNPVAAYANPKYKPSDWEDTMDSYVFKMTIDDAVVLAEEETLPTTVVHDIIRSPKLLERLNNVRAN
jgi:hypothetical protein